MSDKVKILLNAKNHNDAINLSRTKVSGNVVISKFIDVKRLSSILVKGAYPFKIIVKVKKRRRIK